MFKLLKKVFATTPAIDTMERASSPIVNQTNAGKTFHEQGNALLADGHFADAAACYRRAIDAAPMQIDGYISLGYVLIEQEQVAEADRVLQQALGIDRGCVDALYLLATLARNGDRPNDAIGYFERILALKPDFEPLYAELCDVLIRCGRSDDAKSTIAAGITLFPNVAQYHFILGTLHAKSNDHDRALACFKKAMLLQPDYADLHYHLASSLYEQDKIEDAVTSLKTAIAFKPDYLEAYGKLGTALLRLNRYEEALAIYEQELGIEPGNVVALVNQSITLHRLGRNDEAIASCDRALAIKPDSAEAMLNRGVALTALKRVTEALVCYEQANLIKPGDCDILTNRGNALQYLDRHDEALQSFTEALWIRPDHVDANLNLGLSRLQAGDYALGWRQYEWRWHKHPLQKLRPNYSQPLWLGNEDLNGKSILLVAEQGLGDTMQFCRYAQLVSDRGATVLLLVPQVLSTVLFGLKGVDRILTSGDALPVFDYYCPLLSLPLAFNTNVESVPHDIPYLTASLDLTQRIHDELGAGQSVRIGLCWKGSASYAGDNERSPGIAPFANLMSRFVGRNVKFHTLLPDSRDHFVRIGGEDLGHELDCNTPPFAETAALIMNLDLVITCDTSIGHIAGALGKPVWLVVPFAPDWRWIRGRDDSPWYPNTRLIRQTAPGDWEELFDRVTARLNAVLDGSSTFTWPGGPDKAGRTGVADGAGK